MHITILGAGAIGGTIGAFLHRAGHPVTLVARGPHLEAIRRGGLRLLTPAGEETMPIPADDTVPSDTDIILLTVKTADIPLALTLVPDGVPIACLQNGLDSAAAVAYAGHPALAALVYLPATHLVPGEIQSHGWPHPGVVDLGDHPEGAGPLADALAATLRAAGIDSRARADVMAWKRGKLLQNLAGGLEVACGSVEPDLHARLIAEAEAIYRAAELPWIPPETLDRRASIETRPAAGHARRGSSMWQSLTRGRRPEVEAIYDDLLRLAGSTGRDAPTCRRLRNIVAGLRAPAEWNAADLRAALDAPSYTLHDLTMLTGLDAVRRRPGMYVVDPTRDAARELLTELIGNTVDQHLAGRCARVDVTVRPRGFTVADDGPGIAPSLVEPLFTTLFAHGRPDRTTPHVHLRFGLAGCGIAPVNALAARCVVESRHAGRWTRHRFSCGRPAGPFEDLGPVETSGLTVDVELDRTLILARPDIVDAALTLERIAALTTLRCTLNGVPVQAHGLAALIRRHVGPALPETPDLDFTGEEEGVRVCLALWREPTAARGIHGWSFVNFAPVTGGAHVEGLLAALTDAGLARRAWVYGLHVLLTEPRFGQPTRDWLDDPEVNGIVRRVLAPALVGLPKGPARRAKRHE